MDTSKRKALTANLQGLVGEIASDLLLQLSRQGPARQRAAALHAEERVGDDFDVWLDLLSRRAAVLWVLKTVYVRVLEDRGLVTPVRLRTAESQRLFQRLSPGLGDTAFLRWIFRDLASSGGVPELFVPQPAELALPSNSASTKLVEFWRQTDETDQQLKYRFDDEHFDGRLMGDLYQDLDPVVKLRYALLQTPEFVVDFILDNTLTPAIAKFGAEAVRVLDPACGSGHFILAAFKRLVSAMRTLRPDATSATIVRDVLARVVGIDLNDYACGLARARLVMTALEIIGDSALASGSDLHPQVYWADGLEQVEKEEQLEIAAVPDDNVRASLSRPDNRKALRPVLKPGFHVVVANPPYIIERDATRRAYHREKVGTKRRYVTASRKYSLAAPFTERMLQLLVGDGFLGEILANSFMKREFGKPLIEIVLPRFNLTKVIDVSGAGIPRHASTAILFARAQPADRSTPPIVVMGKRGESGFLEDPAQGRVWGSISTAHDTPGYEDDYISVATFGREILAKHPWSIGGGGAAELKQHLDSSFPLKLGQLANSIGFMAITGEDGVFALPRGAWDRLGLDSKFTRPLGLGDGVRNWHIECELEVFFPYSTDRLLTPTELGDALRRLWPYRRLLQNRPDFSGKKYFEVGRDWYGFHQIPLDRLESRLALAFGEVASHNHFGLDTEGRLFNRTAPVIKLRDSSDLSLHYFVLAQLNSSLGEFWMKQVFQPKGGDKVSEDVRVTKEEWEDRRQRDGTKLLNFPLTPAKRSALEALAQSLVSESAHQFADDVVSVLVASAALGATGLTKALADRRVRQLGRIAKMNALQEELDWAAYSAYGLDEQAPANEIRLPEHVAPYRPGLRPFEIAMAGAGAGGSEDSATVEGEPDSPTAWFSRHGWEAPVSLSEIPQDEQPTVEARISRTSESRILSLLEHPQHKRRWYRPDFNEVERKALESWLGSRLEEWARHQTGSFSADDAAAALQGDPAVLAVVEVLAGRPDFALGDFLADRLAANAVPFQKHHLYSPSGLIKRAAWERTWSMQRLADSSDSPDDLTGDTPVPPKYAPGDYLRPEYWAQRGALGVPTERFIMLSEVPGDGSQVSHFAWAGLGHRQRAKMFVELDEAAERAGVERQDRIGLLHAIGHLVPYVAWESEPASREYLASVTAIVGTAGVTEELLSEWASRHPPPVIRRPKAKPRQSKKRVEPKDS